MPDRDARRRFGRRERAALLLAAGGCCADCGAPLAPDFHADHRDPWAHGGRTDVVNGQALCPPCNRRKSDTTPIKTALGTGHDQAASSTPAAGAVGGHEQRHLAHAHDPAVAGKDAAPDAIRRSDERHPQSQAPRHEGRPLAR
jgi:hypothetical protein